MSPTAKTPLNMGHVLFPLTWIKLYNHIISLNRFGQSGEKIPILLQIDQYTLFMLHQETNHISNWQKKMKYISVSSIHCFLKKPRKPYFSHNFIIPCYKDDF
jgi:hypothetical protein